MEMVCGIFIEELQDKVGDKEVALIVMGAGGKVLFFHFGDIYHCEKNFVTVSSDI